MAPDMARDWPETVTLASKQAEFDALIREHRGITFKVASAYARTAEDRQDLVQEIVAQVWRAFPHYDPTRRFSTWMYRIALNVAISLRRSSTLRERHVAPVDTAALEAMSGRAADEPDERLRDLYRVIDALDDFNRALVVLYLEGYDQRDIGDILGLTETNVATRLSRLRQRLRREVATGPATSQEQSHGTR
jgi:RNA polymerase sigma-70 factor (ECF subfamily)